MNNFDDFYPHNRAPTKIMVWSFIVALLVDFVPFTNDVGFWLPELSALMLSYWLIHAPKQINIGMGFAIGLLVDLGTSAPLGQHALAYTLCAFVVAHNHRQISLYHFGLQAIAIFIVLFLNECVLMLVRWLYAHQFTGWKRLLTPIVGALLWPLLNKIMLFIIHFHRTR